MKSTLRFVRLLWILFITVTVISTPVLAFGAEKHDDYLEQVLFGVKMSFDNEIEEKNMQALEYASFLCIDYTKDNKQSTAGQTAYNFLEDFKVGELPDCLSKLEGPGGSSHRQYTHFGWQQGYQNDREDKANWEARKTLLLSTTNKVFDFGWFSKKFSGRLWFDYDAKCDSFSALIYYVHILGDHIYTKSIDTANDMIPLSRSSPSMSKQSLIYELKRHIPIIFADQLKDSKNIPRNYTALMSKIDTIDVEARRILNCDGTLSSSTDVSAYNDCARALMEVLIDYLPPLLEKEDFFTAAFPSIK